MEQIPINSILKSFEGRISNKEQQQLDEWLAASKENRQMFNELKKTYTATGKIKIGFEPDAVNALQNVNRKIGSNKTIRVVWRAAAAVVILLLASQFILRTQMPHTWNEIVAEQQQTVFLPDSSKVILAQNASLKYPDSFTGNKRKTILAGTAYFEITKNPEKPFVIDAPNTQIEVLGTKFLVEADRPDTEKVLVDEGKVAFSTGNIFSRHEVILTKNEVGTWTAENHQLSEQINPEQNSNTWLSGRFSFSDLPLSEVLKTIENHFNIEIELTDKNFENIRYSGHFNEQEDASEILQIICLTLNISFEKEGIHYTLQP